MVCEVKMWVDFDIIIRTNKAYRGDITAMCEMATYFTLTDDWVNAAKFLELLVENEPDICEKKLYAVHAHQVPYEIMLGLIGQTHAEQENWHIAFRWYQKYLDYMEFKHASNKAKWESKKPDDKIYCIMKSNGQLDKIENRFLLKWEQELFIKDKNIKFLRRDDFFE